MLRRLGREARARRFNWEIGWAVCLNKMYRIGVGGLIALLPCKTSLNASMMADSWLALFALASLKKDQKNAHLPQIFDGAKRSN